MSGAAARVYDPSVLAGIVGDDEEVVRDFLADYLASADALAPDIGDALLAGDWPKVAACAHRLKSSSRAVGALALGDACAALEDAALAGPIADVERQRRDFDATVAAMRERVSERIRRGGAAG